MKFKLNLKKIPWILILVCMFLLKSFESQFQHIQKLLILESNNLLSPHNLQAGEEINTRWRQLARPEDSFSVFGLIERSADQQVTAFYTTDYKQISFPLKSGKTFLEEDSGEALVGMGVQTYWVDSNEYYKYEDTKYHVIGKLGISKDSPLKNVILLNNSLLLEQANVPLMFDGPYVNNINWLKGNYVENRGVDRWFNINVISNWISYMTWLVIFCSSTLAIHYYLVITKETRSILIEIGKGQRVIYRKGLWNITAVTLAIVSAMILTYSDKKLFFEFIVSNISIYMVLIISYTIMYWRQR